MAEKTLNPQKIREENKGKKLMMKLKRYRFIYLMLIPVVVYFLVFSYYPMLLGVVNSFREIRLLGGAAFVGWKNYQTILSSPVYSQAFVNTLIVGAGTFVLQFAWGLLLALCLNEIRRKATRSFFQTITYIPYLLSWAVVGSIWITLLSPSGLLTICIYPGHDEGKRELSALLEWASRLDAARFDVIHKHYMNQHNNPPQLIAVRKRP